VLTVTDPVDPELLADATITVPEELLMFIERPDKNLIAPPNPDDPIPATP
jgi:hypothetical protein